MAQCTRRGYGTRTRCVAIAYPLWLPLIAWPNSPLANTIYTVDAPDLTLVLLRLSAFRTSPSPPRCFLSLSLFPLTNNNFNILHFTFKHRYLIHYTNP